MPNIKSAKKRVLVNKTKNLRNKRIKSELKSFIKKADIALENQSDNKEAAIRLAIKKVDMACSKGILHKNTAARRKSRLALALNKASN